MMKWLSCFGISRGLYLVICIGVAAGLSGCVTTTTGPTREADPAKSLESNIQLGIGYIRNGEYDRAKEKLAKAIELDPRSADAYNAYGLLFDVQGESALAEKNYKRSVSLDPGFTKGRNNYGAFLFAQGRYRDAIEQLEIASEDVFYRARGGVFENLGICYLKIGLIAKAESALNRAISLNPRQPRALLELADMEFSKQHFVEANALFKRYTDVSSHGARSLWLGIQLARKFGREDEEASYSLMLKNFFPASEEYKQFLATQ
jgi:type IV pilus assembly protein PilF